MATKFESFCNYVKSSDDNLGTNLTAKGITVPSGATLYTKTNLINSIILGTKSVTANGIYSASSDSWSGYSSVNVNVPAGGLGAYTIRATETADTTFTLTKPDTTTETLTNDATIGGYVDFSVGATGTYTLTATQGGTQKWTTNVVVDKLGLIVVKSPLAMDTYSKDDIILASKNNYAKYLFNLGDYKAFSSFMGSTGTSARGYVTGFDEKGGGIILSFLTPSSYNMDSENYNGVSWIGCDQRVRCSPSGMTYYRYDHTVTSTTSGSRFVYNTTTSSFDLVTLPTDWVSGTKYYNQLTTTADGAIYAGIPSELQSSIIDVQNKTWQGWGGNITSSDNTIITTTDKVWMYSVVEFNGEKIAVWNDRNKHLIEGNFINADMVGFNSNPLSNSGSYWTYRSPSAYNSSGFCYWSGNYGYVSSGNASGTDQALVCVCL